MAKCVGIETGYIKIKMRGDYKYTSKWVGIAWGLRGDGSVTKGVCVGKVYCEQVCVGKFQLEQVCVEQIS